MNRVCWSGGYIYQRFSGEADHEHTSPVAGAGIHILRRGNKYSAAAVVRGILAADDRHAPCTPRPNEHPASSRTTNVIHEAENAMPTPSLTVLLVQSLTLASLMSPASTVEYDRLPERRDHPWTPGPDQWSSVPLLQFERRDDPSWPQADDDSSGSRVALAALVRAIGSHIPGGDAGCRVQQLLVILGYGGPTLTSPAARPAIPAVIARSSPAGAGHRRPSTQPTSLVETDFSCTAQSMLRY